MKSSKLVTLAVSILLAAITVIFCLFAFKTFNSSYNALTVQLNRMLGKSDEPSFAAYQDTYIDGKTVRYNLEKFGGKFLIRVKTKRNPVSFCVTSAPVNGKVLTYLGNENGEASYVPTESFRDYTSSASNCYINENGTFYTKVMRDETNKIIGVSFSEKNSGAKNAYVTKAYLNGDETGNMDTAKANYIQGLNVCTENMNIDKVNSQANSFNYLAHLCRQQADNNNNISYANGDSISAADSSYATAKENMNAAASSAEDAWRSLMETYESETGDTATGHSQITYYEALTNLLDTSNLKYWMNKKNEAGS